MSNQNEKQANPKRHKWADVIHAWAEGEEVQWRNSAAEEWRKVTMFSELPKAEYRIKPRTIQVCDWYCEFPNGDLTRVYGKVREELPRVPGAIYQPVLGTERTVTRSATVAERLDVFC